MFSSILFIYSLLITTPNRVQFLDIGAMALGFPTNDPFSSEVSSVVPLEYVFEAEVLGLLGISVMDQEARLAVLEAEQRQILEGEYFTL